MNYYLLFQDDGGNISSHCNLTAPSNEAAIAMARRDYASDSGAGYEIWLQGQCIHTEFPRWRQAA